MQAPKCLNARLPSWRSGGSKQAKARSGERPSSASVVAAAAAPPASTTGAKGITAAIGGTADRSPTSKYQAASALGA